MMSSTHRKFSLLRKTFIFCSYIPYLFILFYAIWEIVMVITVGRYPIQIQYSGPPPYFVEGELYWGTMFITFWLAVFSVIVGEILWHYLGRKQIEIRKIHRIFFIVAPCIILYIIIFDLRYQLGA